MARLAMESEQEYIGAIRDDLEKSRAFLEEATGNTGVDEIFALSFPEGYYNDEVLVCAKECGFYVSVSTEWGVAEITKGLRQSLMAMRRIGASELSPDGLMERIK